MPKQRKPITDTEAEELLRKYREEEIRALIRQTKHKPNPNGWRTKPKPTLDQLDKRKP
jgi:hypothetical protein